MKSMKKILLSTFIFISCFSVFAITGTEVVEKYFEKNPAPIFSKTEFKLETFKDNKIEDSVSVIQFGRNKNSLTETVFEITKNPTKKGTRFLQSQKEKGADSRWIYMPSLKSTRKIGATDGAKSFVGTEFTYNDTAMREVNEDKHEIFEENKQISIDGKVYVCWVVKSVPVSKKSLEFDYRLQYYDQNTVMPVRIEYFDKTGKMTKIMEIKELATVNGTKGLVHNTRKVTEVINLVTNRRSVLTILNQELDNELKPTYFTQQWLSSGKN